MFLLGIETSCDETSAAVVTDGGRILSNIVSSQIELHKPYGGIVPEIASRNHLQLIDAVVADALTRANISAQQLTAVAATYGPGLASSLLVGLTTAKGIAFALGIPFIGINHLEAHLFSPFLSEEGSARPLGAPQDRQPVGMSLPKNGEPFISLIVSGGHTILALVRGADNYEILGATVDDAAGEAFDKVAKLLGLGYPGGPEIDRLARQGNPAAVDFPRSMLNDPSYNFSFSGIKTAVRYLVKGVPTRSVGKKNGMGKWGDGRDEKDAGSDNPLSLGRSDTWALADVCASFQEAIVDVLVGKTLRAAREKGARIIAVSGGVACNTRLREKFAAACAEKKLSLRVAHPRLCTDNAAMIAALAALKLARGHRSELSLDVQPSLAL